MNNRAPMKLSMKPSTKRKGRKLHRIMIAIRATRVFGLALVFGISAAGQVFAWPDKPVRLIVPFSAGGVVDTIARTVGDRMANRYGVPVVVENRVGAGGSIGIEFVARAPPDGYTLLFVAPGFLTLPALQKNLKWDPMADFAPVAGIGEIPNVIVVHPETPVRNMAELIAWAKRQPDGLTYGSSGIGTTQHLSGELLARQAGIKLVHVPYKGQPDAATDVIAGRLDFMPLSVGLAAPFIRTEKLRALAVTTARRARALADLPTVEQAAHLPGYAVSTWLGIVAPGKTPAPTLQKLSDDLVSILREPPVQEKAEVLGLEINILPGAEFASWLAGEQKKWVGLGTE